MEHPLSHILDNDSNNGEMPFKQSIEKKGINLALLSKEEIYILKTIRILERHHQDYNFNYSPNFKFKKSWNISIQKPSGEVFSIKGPVSLKQALEFFEHQTKHNLKEEKKVNIKKDFVLKLSDNKKFFAAVAIIFKGNKVLMGKSLGEDDRFGKLVFPGGHIDKGEDPYVAAKREAKEETGLAVKYRPLPIIEDVPTRPIEGKKDRKIAFIVCDYVGGNLKHNEEFEYLEWVNLSKVDWSKVYKQNVKILKALLEK